MNRDAFEQIQTTLTWVSDDTLQLMIADLERFGHDVTMLQACRALLEKRRMEQPKQENVIEL